MNKPHPLRMAVQLTIAFFLILFSMFSVFSQVKIGDNPTVISPSAILETESTTKGFLKPRLTTAQRTAIAAPATGLEVYDTDTQSNWYYNGTVWVNGASTNIYNADGTLTGNRTVTQGANTLTFTGSAVNAFSVDGTTFSVDAANNAIGLGTAAPNTNAVIDATAVNKGILFPRVALTATNLPAPLSAFVAGMTVYNTATASTGSTAVTPGLYYTDGTKWVQTGDDYAPDPTVGSISAFPFSAIPTGYLECNGAAVSRSTYSALFAKIGTSYGAGDGSTTFNVPDLRGEFIRGWDNGRGVDAGRTIASSQADATSLPNAAFTTNTVAAHTHSVDPPSTSTSSAGAHTHTLERRSNSDENSYDTGNGRQDESSAATTDRGTLGPFSTSSAGAHTHTTDIAAFNSAAAGSHNHTISGGDAETRPRNVAMVYAIKAQESVLVPSSTSTAVAAAAAANEPWFKVGTTTGATSNTDDLYSMGNRVGIGTATPAGGLHILNDGGSAGDDDLLVEGYGGSASHPTIFLYKSVGTVASPTNVPNGTVLGDMYFGGRWNATENRYSGVSAIQSTYKGDGTTSLTDLTFRTSGSDRMIINENGNVGIGTTTPSALVHINSAVATSDLLRLTEGTGPTINDWSIDLENAGTQNGFTSKRSLTLVDRSSNIRRMTISESGEFRIGGNIAVGNAAIAIDASNRVGIGINTPSDALHVIGGGLIVGSPSTQSTASQGAHIEWNRDNNGHIHILNQKGLGSGGIRFGSLSSTNVETEWARFNDNGFLGIGTSNPLVVLTSETPSISVKALSLTRANVEKLFFVPECGLDAYNDMTSAGDVGIFFGNSTGNVIGVGAATSRGLVIGPWNANTNQLAMKITEAGNVGIGTGAPATKLDIRGAKVGYATGTGANSNDPSYAIIGAGASGTTIANDWPATWGGGLSTFDIVGASTYFSNYVTRSDSTLKKNIQPLTADMADVFMKIRPVTYLMKEETPELPGIQYGFIAQEVGELFPSLVTTKTDPSGTIGMNYQGLIAPTVYMVQEQQRLLEQQQKEITTLKKDVEALKELMKQYLEKR